jgi:NCAIR mutase (PurE)-related protein
VSLCKLIEDEGRVLAEIADYQRGSAFLGSAALEQTLLYFGQASERFVDVGVASFWRLTDRADELNDYTILIAIAGMEGVLFSVLSGLVKAPVITVPTSVGYGVGVGGHAALNSALRGCSPGLAVVDIDNGFGASARAIKILNIHVPET